MHPRRPRGAEIRPGRRRVADETRVAATWRPRPRAPRGGGWRRWQRRRAGRRRICCRGCHAGQVKAGGCARLSLDLEAHLSRKIPKGGGGWVGFGAEPGRGLYIYIYIVTGGFGDEGVASKTRRCVRQTTDTSACLVCRAKTTNCSSRLGF